MHIWMEADIIRLIVSDARWAVKTTLDFAWTQILDAKNQKTHCSRRVVSTRRMSNEELSGSPLPSGTGKTTPS